MNIGNKNEIRVVALPSLPCQYQGKCRGWNGPVRRTCEDAMVDAWKHHGEHVESTVVWNEKEPMTWQV